MNYAATLQDARDRDAADPLRAFRARFALPRDARGAQVVYLSGHSLGLAPLAARELLVAGAGRVVATRGAGPRTWAAPLGSVPRKPYRRTRRPHRSASRLKSSP